MCRRSSPSPLVLDDYDTHEIALVRRWLAQRPRFHLHFTPTGASWLDLVERWFALLTEKQLRRGVHRSIRELEAPAPTALRRRWRPSFWPSWCDRR